MKKVLFICLFVFISFQIAEAKVLTKDEVSITVPDEWSDNISNSADNLIISLYIADDDKDFKENVVITKEKVTPQYNTIPQYKEAALTSFKGIFHSFSVIENKGNYLLISHKLPDDNVINQLIYFYIKNDNFYSVIFTAASKEYKDLIPFFSKMEKSFKIK